MDGNEKTTAGPARPELGELLAALLPVDMAMLLCSWLAIRVALRG